MAKYLIDIGVKDDESFSEHVWMDGRFDRTEAIRLGRLLFIDRVLRSPKLKARVSAFATSSDPDGFSRLYVHSCYQLT